MFARLFILEARRACARRECKAAVTIMLLFALIGFAQTCWMFFGEEAGSVPGAAYGWAWNNLRMQAHALMIYIALLLFPVAALVAAGNLAQEVREGTAAAIASRTSTPTYIWANATVAFVGGFLITLAMAALLQVLALVTFPIEGSFAGSMNAPVYLEAPADGLFAGLSSARPYLANTAYALYASAWAGIVALLSFAVSLLARTNRWVAWGVPVGFGVLSSAAHGLLSSSGAIGFNTFIPSYLFPNPSANLSVAFAVIAPAVVFGLSLLIIAVAIRMRRDVLL